MTTMNPDDEPSPPPSNARPFLQPSRRSRIGRQARQAPERRIPGEKRPETRFVEEPAATESVAREENRADREDFYAPPSGETPGDPSPGPVGEDPAAHGSAYRPPARGVETIWRGQSSAPSPPAGLPPTGAPSARVFTPDLPPRRAGGWPAALLAIGLVASGTLGYGLGRAGRTESGSRVIAAAAPVTLSPLAGSLPADVLALVVRDLDAAFTSLKAGRFADAAAGLQAAQERRPTPSAGTSLGRPGGGGWPSLEVERARVLFYANDLAGADRVLDTLLRSGDPGTVAARADAQLLRALIQGALRNPAAADDCFAAAVSEDPARADTFFFWGNALRNQGKPVESIPKFRSALLRNQFETIDGLYRLKLWLSQLQVDSQIAEVNAALDIALTVKPPAQPTGYAWLGAAARAVRGKHYTEAASHLTKARAALEPVILRVALSDPFFAQENWRPELAEFFK